jgi:predicted metal-binding protein
MEKQFIAVVQCHLVKQRCSGYLCERAFHQRLGGFARYPADAPLRSMHLTCGGCCGRPVQRKLANLLKMIRKKEGIERDRVGVHLSSCITRDNHHGPPCPHLEYLEAVIGKLGLDVVRDTTLSERAEQRRAEGVYEP